MLLQYRAHVIYDAARVAIERGRTVEVLVGPSRRPGRPESHLTPRRHGARQLTPRGGPAASSRRYETPCRGDDVGVMGCARERR